MRDVGTVFHRRILYFRFHCVDVSFSHCLQTSRDYNCDRGKYVLAWEMQLYQSSQERRDGLIASKDGREVQ